MAIVQLTHDDEFILEYNSLGDVIKLGFDYYKVRNALNKDELCQGYRWKSMKNTDDIHEYNDRYFKPINPTNPVKVEQCGRYGKHIAYWDNIESATINLSIPDGGIENCLNGETKTSGGYVWKEC